ncbi:MULTISPECIES: hypothetical protein [Cyanophyceae]|uniref:hypothetical protein n=1 Tax=Cyanophyceae TaxID=3028117 RepID=UPI00168427A3|nr:hypothetical protein [Trichocoleus sp. FACHB-40]MBD2005443.1 hypothetical protein [Trichocoleus sp. FACHB-40]
MKSDHVGYKRRSHCCLRAAETNVRDRSVCSCLRSRFYSFKMSIVPVTPQLCFQIPLLYEGRRLHKRLGCG